MKPEVNKLSIKNLHIDKDIYPRKSIIQSLVESYAEALKAGAIFPPIKVQKIIEGNEEKILEDLDSSLCELLARDDRISAEKSNQEREEKHA